MTKKNDKRDAAELEALNAKISAFEATVERLMKDRAVHEPVDAIIRALRGHTLLEIDLVLDAIRDEVFDTLADENADDSTADTWLPMVCRRNVLRKRLKRSPT